MNEVVAADIHPIVRVLMIAVMTIIPVLVVVLQRLPALREVLKKDPPQSKSEFFSLGAQDDITICPKCFSQVLIQHSFCGFCGHPLTQAIKKQNGEEVQ